MVSWLVVYVTPAALVTFTSFIALFFIFRRWCRRKADDCIMSDTESGQVFAPGVHRRLHQVTPDHNHGGVKSFRCSPFRWDDHPSLVVDAVENGWSRFAFTVFASSPLKPAKTLSGHVSDQTGVAIGWEVCEGSSEFMQKIQLNPARKTAITSNHLGFSVIRTALPLPGPNIRNSFPQEAYFEITVLRFNDNGVGDQLNPRKSSEIEGDKVKLITLDFNAKNSSENMNFVTSNRNNRRSKIEDAEIAFDSISVGLGGGGPLQIRFPGTYPGSIGFNSSGAVYLGNKLLESSEKSEWNSSGKVVGCGFNPAKRKVFFTVDGRQVYEIFCKAEEFAVPLYPTLAANVDVTVVVNLGQRKFSYDPANLSRNHNPCFVTTPATSPSLGFEDSRDLFSMGRIESELWIRRCAASKTENLTNKNLEYDQESEGDLFEIPLDGLTTGRSPLRSPANNR